MSLTKPAETLDARTTRPDGAPAPVEAPRLASIQRAPVVERHFMTPLVTEFRPRPVVGEMELT